MEEMKKNKQGWFELRDRPAAEFRLDRSQFVSFICATIVSYITILCDSLRWRALAVFVREASQMI